MSSLALHEEIINEIGTQTLARFGLNIFSLNTYDAYGASVEGTTNVFDAYDKHKNNPNYFGQTFEDLDVAQRNINSALHNEDVFFSTTDNLGEVNHPVTDVRKLSKDGQILENYQHKVIKDSKGLFGKDNKYLENDKIVVASDDYDKHKNYLENMIKNTKDEDTRRNAKELLSKLEKSDISRKEAENARTTAVGMQTKQGLEHIAQAGISDAVVVALSSLANGAIFEIKDAYSNGGVSISMRIKRLLKKVLDDFYQTFKRGATYGTVDVAVGILSQIFKSISSKITTIWKSLRSSMKSIFNAIWDFMTGKIKSYKDLLATIIKGIISAVMVLGTVALEIQLEAFLSPIVTPLVASFLAPALAIIIGSIAVVVSMRSIDLALNTLFSTFANRDMAKMRAEEVHKICADMLPDLIKETEELQALIDKTYKERKLTFEVSFSEFKNGLTDNDVNRVMCGLIEINKMYGKTLQYSTFEEFDTLMCSDEAFKF